MPEITFRNGPKKSANDMIKFWKMTHPKYVISGIKIDKGNITLTYNDKSDEKEKDTNGKVQDSSNSTDND